MKMMKKSMTVITIIIIIFFTWALWVSNQSSRRRKLRQIIGKDGRVFDIELDENPFDIDGFTYYNKSPLRNVKLKAKSIWFVSGLKGQVGTIVLGGLQNKRLRPKDVTVVIKYHVHWDGAAYLTVVGTDLHVPIFSSIFTTFVKEQVSEDLPQEGDSFCTRVVFLGAVDEVKVEAVAHEKKSFVVIDELKVAVGSKVFDTMDEVVCQ